MKDSEVKALMEFLLEKIDIQDYDDMPPLED